MPALRLRTLLPLLGWLGPWTAGHRVPSGARRETWVVQEGQLHGHRAWVAGQRPSPGRRSRLEAHVYRPRRSPVGAYLLVPGLHFLGPDDPRLDRFCRVLAEAGFLVVAPFLPAFVDLLVRPSAADDLELFARELVRREPALCPFAVFSISFGSWPALEVAVRMGEAVERVITFGGYADFAAAVRFCVEGVAHTPEGDVVLPRDPLNSPALFLNVLPFIDAGESTEALEAAWRQMAYRTWGRPDLKVAGARRPIAHELLRQVPEAQRRLFLVGCGLLPGAVELVDGALNRAGTAFDFADPGTAAGRLRCPLVVCHGRSDDVIPYHEARKLGGLCRHARVLVTGLYGHTGAGTVGAASALREARTLLQVARVMAR